ncbi:hypothetical protein Salat_1895400 [Sesamum alatum]|uniref:CCHC-type domain-containing protein n=1 Tax=Sesamum alatum TaxID=300844 RepID=A0AAE1Y3S1_9LAMI|nr:hypothetical protein Salat_1895400 [Sesamum alatum]
MAETGRQRGSSGQDRSLEGPGMDEALVSFRGRLRLTEDEGQRLVLLGGMINPVKGIDIRQLGGGSFLLRFNHVIDRNRALEGCPWSFEKNVIILSGIGETENLLRVDLDWCEFHVYVHELPLSMINLGVAMLIGNRIGRFRDMDMDDIGCAWGATLRLRVAVNVNRPLPRAMQIVSTVGDEFLLHLIYERLPNFCYFCGKLGHITKYCDLQFEEGFVDPGSDSLYEQGDTEVVQRDRFRADSIECFSPGRLGRQGRAQSDERVAPVTLAHDEQGLEDSIMDSVEQGDGVPVVPMVGGEHVLEAEKGADTSAKFVPSTIPEFELGAAVWAKDRMMVRLEGDLVTIPLRFIARGQSGPAAGVWSDRIAKMVVRMLTCFIKSYSPSISPERQFSISRQGAAARPLLGGLSTEFAHCFGLAHDC